MRASLELRARPTPTYRMCKMARTTFCIYVVPQTVAGAMPCGRVFSMYSSQLFQSTQTDQLYRAIPMQCRLCWYIGRIHHHFLLYQLMVGCRVFSRKRELRCGFSQARIRAHRCGFSQARTRRTGSGHSGFTLDALAGRGYLELEGHSLLLDCPGHEEWTTKSVWKAS